MAPHFLFQYLQLAKRLHFGYNPLVRARYILTQEVVKMFFFSCNTNCNTDCNAFLQLLSRLCGFGC